MPNIISKLPEKNKSKNYTEMVEIVVVDSTKDAIINVMRSKSPDRLRVVYEAIENILDASAIGDQFSVIMRIE